MELTLTDTERANAIADLKTFNTDELTITRAGLQAAVELRKAIATLVGNHDAEDFVDLVAEFALDDRLTDEDFADAIALATAELDIRAN